MDQFLEEFESGGVMDSAGVFTIDSRRAQMKLAEYQLASFDLYPDFFVSAAVAAGARSLDLTVRSNRKLATGNLSTFYFRGWALSLEDLESLKPERSGGNRAIEHLAVALSTLSSRYVVLLRSRQNGETLSVRIHAGSMETRIVSDPRHPNETTTIRLALDVTGPVVKSFERMKTWCPIQLSYNQTLYKTGPRHSIDVLSSAGILVGSACPSSFLEFEANEAPIHLDEGDRTDSDSYFLALTSAAAAAEVGLVLLYDGKAYPVLQKLTEMGVCGYLSAVGLRRDLSFTGLLESEEYFRRIEALWEQVGRLLLLTLQSGRTLTQPQQLNIHLLLAVLDEHLDVSEHWRALEKVSAELEPTTDETALNLQLQQLARKGDQGESLLQGYQTCLEAVRKKGLSAKAEAYLRNKIKVGFSLGKNSLFDKLQEQLFALLNDTYVEPEFSDFPDLQAYLVGLHEWEEAGTPNLTKDLSAGVHPSWHLPFALHRGICLQDWSQLDELEMEPLPAWVSFVRLLGEGREGEALVLLRGEPELCFEEARELWYHFLWFNLRGRVPFTESIRFRAGLSAAELSRSGFNPFKWSAKNLENFLAPKRPLERHKELSSLREYCVEEAYFTARFWPLFFIVLLESQAKSTRLCKRFWTQLCAQSLLHAVQTAGPESPLGVPFFHEPLSR